MIVELVVALGLIVLNAAFALSELSIVSARKTRLRSMAEGRRVGARAALALADDPGRFLSSVQIGITLVGIVAGAFSGAALGERLSSLLGAWGLSTAIAGPLGYGLVIGIITYLSVVIGELVPKHLALRDPEGIACAVAPTMTLVASVAGPVVWFLDASTRLVMRVIGQHAATESAVTAEEIRTLVAEAEHAGVIETDERLMIAGVLRLGDRTVRGILTPRIAVDMLNLSSGVETLRAALLATRHSRLPVTTGAGDDIVGIVQVRDVLAELAAGRALDIASHIRPAPIVPDTLDAIGVMKVLREAAVPMALVHDEYGHFEGIVTPANALDAIVGAVRSQTDELEPDFTRREDGSLLLSGSMPFDEAADLIGIQPLGPRRYQTVAGFVIDLFQRIPATGEIIVAQGWRFEIVDLDGLRVDKVLASRVEDPNFPT